VLLAGHRRGRVPGDAEFVLLVVLARCEQCRPRLSRLRASWAAAGVVAPWGAAPEPATTRWVGVPGMSALVRHLLSEQAVSLGVEVQALERRAEGWRLRAAGARVEGAFDAVLLAVPAPQARALLEGHGALAERLAEVEMDPCWTALAVADQAALSAPSLALEGEGALAWVARDSTKPGRDPSGATWVLQAGPGWSRRHLEEAPEVVARLLWQALGDQVTDRLPEPGYLTAHRWRYARVARPLGEDCLWDATLALGACGDWCLAGRVEAALLSGAALAGRLMVQAL
jgi:predicted NAD/FAD-dependent oxidoreductase